MKILRRSILAIGVIALLLGAFVFFSAPNADERVDPEPSYDALERHYQQANDRWFGQLLARKQYDQLAIANDNARYLAKGGRSIRPDPESTFDFYDALFKYRREVAHRAQTFAIMMTIWFLLCIASLFVLRKPTAEDS